MEVSQEARAGKKNPQDLVCAPCWRNLFNTDEYERLCRFQPTGELPKTSVTAKWIESKSVKCNWCIFLRSIINAYWFKDRWGPDVPLMIRIKTSSLDTFTPKGNNLFDLRFFEEGTVDIEQSPITHIHACAERDDEAAQYVTARPFRPLVSGPDAAAQVRMWLENCRSHDCCSAPHTLTPLPTRVIEVSPSEQQRPRLVNTSKGSQGVYATLSYCWGTVPFPRLLTSNYDQFIQGIDVETWPAAVQDAITIARSLSIPYLWIDALCIIQDSAEDKAIEIGLMNTLYASSALTIVAACSKSVFQGFLHPRNGSSTSNGIPFRIAPGHFGTISVGDQEPEFYEEQSEPIAERAWVLQEQLLAQRTLTFTSRTVMWRCKAGVRNFGDSLYLVRKREKTLGKLLPSEATNNTNADLTLRCWMDLVMVYSLRKASLESDKLNALAGIASHPLFSRALGPKFHAGLWEYELVRQLTWSPGAVWSGMESIRPFRPKTYRAPSWSWASVEGEIEFPPVIQYPEVDTVCDIIQCSTTLKSMNTSVYGEVAGGQLTARTNAMWAWFKEARSKFFPFSRPFGQDLKLKIPGEDGLVTHAEAIARHHKSNVQSRFDLEEPPEYVHSTDIPDCLHIANKRTASFGLDDKSMENRCLMVLCVIMLHDKSSRKVYGLLLIPSEEAGHDQKFKRIGRFFMHHTQSFLDEPKIEVCIV